MNDRLLLDNIIPLHGTPQQTLDEAFAHLLDDDFEELLTTRAAQLPFTREAAQALMHQTALWPSLTLYAALLPRYAPLLTHDELRQLCADFRYEFNLTPAVLAPLDRLGLTEAELADAAHPHQRRGAALKHAMRQKLTACAHQP